MMEKLTLGRMFVKTADGRIEEQIHMLQMIEELLKQEE